MKNVSLHELQLLTGTNYQVLKQLLAGVPFTRGPNRAHIFNSVEALRAIYTVSPTTLDQMKLRNETLTTSLKEVELAKKTKGLLPDQFCFGLIDTFIKFCAGRFEDLRLRGIVDREWIAKYESRWTELYREFCGDYELTLPEASQTQQNS
jgi:hypothetical protein